WSCARATVGVTTRVTPGPGGTPRSPNPISETAWKTRLLPSPVGRHTTSTLPAGAMSADRTATRCPGDWYRAQLIRLRNGSPGAPGKSRLGNSPTDASAPDDGTSESHSGC